MPRKLQGLAQTSPGVNKGLKGIHICTIFTIIPYLPIAVEHEASLDTAPNLREHDGGIAMEIQDENMALKFLMCMGKGGDTTRTLNSISGLEREAMGQR